MPTGTDEQARPVPPGPNRGVTANRLREDRGSAVVEFLGLTFVLLVPLFYVLLFVSQAQAAAYGAVAAADQAARAAVSQEQGTAGASVHAVAQRTLKDYGVLADMYDVTVQCDPGSCLERQPGMVAQVQVRVEVPLPVLDQLFGIAAAPVTVTSDARHRVPRF